MIPSKLHPMVPVQWYFGAIGLYFTFDHTLFRGRGMVSAMLLSISIVALSQFALYYWRAVVAGGAPPPGFCRGVVAAPRGDGGAVAPHFRNPFGPPCFAPALPPKCHPIGFVL